MKRGATMVSVFGLAAAKAGAAHPAAPEQPPEQPPEPDQPGLPFGVTSDDEPEAAP